MGKLKIKDQSILLGEKEVTEISEVKSALKSVDLQVELKIKDQIIKTQTKYLKDDFILLEEINSSLTEQVMGSFNSAIEVSLALKSEKEAFASLSVMGKAVIGGQILLDILDHEQAEAEYLVTGPEAFMSSFQVFLRSLK